MLIRMWIIFLWRQKNCELLFRCQEIIFKLLLFLLLKSFNISFEADVLEEASKNQVTSSAVPSSKEKNPHVGVHQVLGEPNKADRRVKAVSTVPTSVFRPLSGIDIRHLQDVANVQLLVRPWPHIWAWSYQLAVAAALRCPGGYNQRLWSSALQLSPIARSLWYMSLCPAAVTI